MPLKDELKRTLPEDILLTPEFTVFSKLCDKAAIKDPASLRSYLDGEISRCQNWMDKNKKQSRSGTMTRWLRYYAKRLDFLRLCRQKIMSRL